MAGICLALMNSAMLWQKEENRQAFPPFFPLPSIPTFPQLDSHSLPFLSHSGTTNRFCSCSCQKPTLPVVFRIPSFPAFSRTHSIISFFCYIIYFSPSFDSVDKHAFISPIKKKNNNKLL